MAPSDNTKTTKPSRIPGSIHQVIVGPPSPAEVVTDLLPQLHGHLRQILGKHSEVLLGKFADCNTFATSRQFIIGKSTGQQARTVLEQAYYQAIQHMRTQASLAEFAESQLPESKRYKNPEIYRWRAAASLISTLTEPDAAELKKHIAHARGMWSTYAQLTHKKNAPKRAARKKGWHKGSKRRQRKK